MVVRSCEKLGKCFLVNINILFILLGLAFLIPGILVRLDVDIVNEKVIPLLKTLSVGGLSLGDAIHNLSITLIALGVAIILLAGMGFCGACCSSKCLLFVYSSIVIVITLAEIAIVVLWFVMKDKVEKEVKEQLVSQLENNYRYDDLTSHEISTAWNYGFMLLHCCGVNQITGTTNDFDNTVWQNAGSPGYQIPKACCGASSLTYTSYSNSACTHTVTSGYYTTGCYDTIYGIVKTYGDTFIGVGIALVVIQTLAVLFACNIICKDGGKIKY